MQPLWAHLLLTLTIPSKACCEQYFIFLVPISPYLGCLVQSLLVQRCFAPPIILCFWRKKIIANFIASEARVITICCSRNYLTSADSSRSVGHSRSHGFIVEARGLVDIYHRTNKTRIPQYRSAHTFNGVSQGSSGISLASCPLNFAGIRYRINSTGVAPQ